MKGCGRRSQRFLRECVEIRAAGEANGGDLVSGGQRAEAAVGWGARGGRAFPPEWQSKVRRGLYNDRKHEERSGVGFLVAY